jgi:hypothetical protein
MKGTCTSGELIPSPEVRQFADTYHVLTRRDACGELIALVNEFLGPAAPSKPLSNIAQIPRNRTQTYE